MTAMMPPLVIGPIGAAEVEAFARASGDTNPLHVSAAIARTIGLEAAPVHGMLLVAYLNEAVRRFLPQAVIAGLSTRFMAPVPVGAEVEISGRTVKRHEDGEPAVLRLFVKTSGGVIACMAEATLSRAMERGS
ncbi:MaoC family dehydratase [Labrys sp. ZIDIC5]|uniref:MaoC family dehydratase n=1 Tax=Labrys sedimenti TaxID=3106036 RepID=UPI002ACA6D59|nr:MaoC family dehydratase [Labrys sp. ZIDIC5]MDZ5450886.1 MaoC family dehydratase [Labrys sp. ZIDIC5]